MRIEIKKAILQTMIHTNVVLPDGTGGEGNGDLAAVSGSSSGMSKFLKKYKLAGRRSARTAVTSTLQTQVT
jgi:hypothetical protein